MGNYIIVIVGAGPHDTNKASDVEQQAARFVEDLTAQGHSIADVHVAIGQPKRLQRDLAPVANALPELADPLEDLMREARAAYERYGERAKWMTYDGKPMPDFEKLTPEVQDRWCAAVDWYGVQKKRNEHVQGSGVPGDHAPPLPEQAVPNMVTPEMTSTTEPAPLPPTPDEETTDVGHPPTKPPASPKGGRP